jgi:hypothetical protein
MNQQEADKIAEIVRDWLKGDDTADWIIADINSLVDEKDD